MPEQEPERPQQELPGGRARLYRGAWRIDEAKRCLNCKKPSLRRRLPGAMSRFPNSSQKVAERRLRGRLSDHPPRPTPCPRCLRPRLPAGDAVRIEVRPRHQGRARRHRPSRALCRRLAPCQCPGRHAAEARAQRPQGRGHRLRPVRPHLRGRPCQEGLRCHRV